MDFSTNIMATPSEKQLRGLTVLCVSTFVHRAIKSIHLLLLQHLRNIHSFFTQATTLCIYHPPSHFIWVTLGECVSIITFSWSRCWKSKSWCEHLGEWFVIKPTLNDVWVRVSLSASLLLPWWLWLNLTITERSSILYVLGFYGKCGTASLFLYMNQEGAKK